MGQTWKCASLSGDILQKLLRDVQRKAAGVPAENPSERRDGTQTGAVNVSELLRQDPDIARQLRSMGWAPPGGIDAPTPQSGALQDPNLASAMEYNAVSLSTDTSYSCYGI